MIKRLTGFLMNSNEASPKAHTAWNTRTTICFVMLSSGVLSPIMFGFYGRYAASYYAQPATSSAWNTAVLAYSLALFFIALMWFCFLLLMFVRPTFFPNVAAMFFCIFFADFVALIHPDTTRIDRTVVRKSVEQNAAELIEKIDRYTEEHGTPPEKLADLVPNYLPWIPEIGPPRFPQTHYRSGGTHAEPKAAWNLWIEFRSPRQEELALHYSGVRNDQHFGDKNIRSMPRPEWKITTPILLNAVEE